MKILKGKKNKFGITVLFFWLLTLIVFILFVVFDLLTTTELFNQISAALIILLFPMWALILGNKLVRIISLVIFFIIGFPLFIYLFILQPNRVTGRSMTPCFGNGVYVLTEKVTYHFSKPKRSDVIIFTPPIEKNSEYIARIIGLPGENIAIRNGKVYINNLLLNEPYVDNEMITKNGIFITEANILIPNDAYAVMGDNRDSSTDSRFYGFIKRNSIKGRVFYIYSPADMRGPVKSYQTNLFSDSKISLTISPSCKTLSTRMVVGSDGMGQIGCDIKVDGEFDLSESYCESQKTHIAQSLIPDSYGRSDQYYATLKGLDLNEEVKVYIYSSSGQRVECAPTLNRN